MAIKQEIQLTWQRLSELKQYLLEGNSKRHDTKKLTKSLKRYGFQDPIKLDRHLNSGKGGIVEGNGRLEALLNMHSSGELPPKNIQLGEGKEWLVPVLVGADLDNEEQAIAYSLDHNFSNLWGTELEIEGLKLFAPEKALEQINSLGDAAPLLICDRSTEELLAELNASIPQDFARGRTLTEEQIEEMEQQFEEGFESRCEFGDVWKLGDHRILCGDSLDFDLVEKFIGDRQIDLIWSDPPYGMNCQKDSGKIGGGGSKRKYVPTKKYLKVKGDETADTAIASFNYYHEKYPKANQIWWGANHYGIGVPSKCWIVWDKKNGDTNFADAELAWTNSKGAVRIFSFLWSGFTREGEASGKRRVHPNQKPIELCEWYFEKYGSTSDLILDPFLGSGTSLIAAQRLGERSCLAIEYLPEYCEVAIRRWEQVTDRKAEFECNILEEKNKDIV